MAAYQQLCWYIGSSHSHVLLYCCLNHSVELLFGASPFAELCQCCLQLCALVTFGLLCLDYVDSLSCKKCQCSGALRIDCLFVDWPVVKVEILLELLIGFQNLVTGPGARTARPGAESQGYHATFTWLLGLGNLVVSRSPGLPPLSSPDLAALPPWPSAHLPGHPSSSPLGSWMAWLFLWLFPGLPGAWPKPSGSS